MSGDSDRWVERLLRSLGRENGATRPSLVVAEHVLWLRGRADLETTPMHVLKIVYVCHGWMLAVDDEALITEPVEAWTYGPVVPTVYHRYKRYGAQSIFEDVDDRSGELGESAQALMGVIEEAYRPYTAAQLSALTHQPGTPWDVTRRRHGIGAVIPNELIQEHFSELLANSNRLSDGGAAG